MRIASNALAGRYMNALSKQISQTCFKTECAMGNMFDADIEDFNEVLLELLLITVQSSLAVDLSIGHSEAARRLRPMVDIALEKIEESAHHFDRAGIHVAC